MAKTSEATEAAFEKAVRQITKASAELLEALPPRKNPPPTLPPLRRIAARNDEAHAHAHAHGIAHTH